MTTEGIIALLEYASVYRVSMDAACNELKAAPSANRLCAVLAQALADRKIRAVQGFGERSLFQTSESGRGRIWNLKERQSGFERIRTLDKCRRSGESVNLPRTPRRLREISEFCYMSSFLSRVKYNYEHKPSTNFNHEYSNARLIRGRSFQVKYLPMTLNPYSSHPHIHFPQIRRYSCYIRNPNFPCRIWGKPEGGGPHAPAYPKRLNLD